MHGGVGIVEAVGPDVRRVQVGDRVIVGVTPECGQCYQCLHGRADRCQVLFGGIFGGVPTPDPVFPFATLADGTTSAFCPCSTTRSGRPETHGSVHHFRRW